MFVCKKFFIFNLWLILTLGFLTMTSCDEKDVSLPLQQSRPINTKSEDNKNPAAITGTSVTFKGVSFSIDKSFETAVLPEQTKDSPLENESDKPDSVFPSHILFRFQGKYGDQHKDSAFSPELHIYPIEEYRKQLKVSNTELARFNQNLSDLKKILAEKKPKIEKDLPFVNFIDAEQAFHAKMEFAEFYQGAGVWFLTQYNIEPTLINNQGLTYIFQGISQDNKYFVLATFPVTTSFLPANSETTKVDNYSLPEVFQAEHQEEYEKYLRTVQVKIENASSPEFNPNLEYFKKIVASLKIDSSEPVKENKKEKKTN